ECDLLVDVRQACLTRSRLASSRTERRSRFHAATRLGNAPCSGRSQRSSGPVARSTAVTPVPPVARFTPGLDASPRQFDCLSAFAHGLRRDKSARHRDALAVLVGGVPPSSHAPRG